MIALHREWMNDWVNEYEVTIRSLCIILLCQGLLVLILYGVVRNPLLACVFGPKNASYAVSSDFDNFFPTTSSNFHFHASQGSADTPKGSRASLLNEVIIARFKHFLREFLILFF